MPVFFRDLYFSRNFFMKYFRDINVCNVNHLSMDVSSEAKCTLKWFRRICLRDVFRIAVPATYPRRRRRKRLIWHFASAKNNRRVLLRSRTSPLPIISGRISTFSPPSSSLLLLERRSERSRGPRQKRCALNSIACRARRIPV